MKIGILIDQLVPGGVQKSAIQEAIELKNLGHKVTIFVLVKMQYQYQYEDLSRGLKVVYLSDYNPPFFRKPIFIPYFAFLTHLHLLNPFFAYRYKFLEGLDFIISHGTTTCITAAAIGRKLKIPYVAFIWDPMLFILDKVYGSKSIRHLFFLIKPLLYRYERSFLLSAAIVATSSKVHQEFIKKAYQIDPVIIYPACDPTLRPIKKAGNYILSYTRWELAKNPQLILWLAKKLPNYKFLLAGTWTNKNEEYSFREMIKKNKLTDRVVLELVVDRLSLAKIAGKSIVWLHPNFEAFGIAGLEMASLGLPIIIPRGSGVTELFQHSIHGFFPENDKKEFLKYLTLLLKNPNKTIKMGEKASKIAQTYTWQRHAINVLDYMNTYLKRHKILCLANAFVASHSLGGGDQFLIELASRVPDSIFLTIISPRFAYYHWKKAIESKENIRLILLPQNLFDNRDFPLYIFLAYLIRSLQTILLVPKLPNFDVLHTATDIIADTIPAYFYKLNHKKIKWAARFFHFIESPLKRKGKIFINVGSYLLQQTSLRLLTQAEVVMADNPSLKKDLIVKGIQNSKISINTGGVDTKAISSQSSKKNFSSSALFTGRLHPHKGVFEAIESAKIIKTTIPDFSLNIIGYGPPEITQKLRLEISKEKLTKNIHLLGFISNKKTLFTYYRSSKIFLFLDHEAGFGLVIAEAMAAGLPVIAYNLPIFGEIYKRGFRTVPLGNTDAIANEVSILMGNKQIYGKLSKEAQEEAKKFDWQFVSRKFYKDLIILGRSNIQSSGKNIEGAKYRPN